jgi:hypothetical protein
MVAMELVGRMRRTVVRSESNLRILGQAVVNVANISLKSIFARWG